METAKRQKGPRGSERILYVSDPSSIARKLLPDPVREEDLRNWVDMVAASGVDLFGQEVFSMGWTTYWRSATYEYDQRPQHRRFLPLIEAGLEPLEILIDQTHRRGMRFVAGIRVNDNHAHQAREQGVGIAEFIDANPQLQLRDFPEGEYYKLSDPLDFSFEEVREFTLGVSRELAARFDIDGIELCYRDHAYFPVGTGRERGPLMTDLVQKIRALLDEGDKKLILGARVFATIAECENLGLDVPEWIGARLIDYVSPQDTMYADFNLPYEPWAALTLDAECLLFPGLQPWTSFRARYRRNQSPISNDTARALAHTMYRAGADGISIYNHFVPTLWHPPFYPQAMNIFHQLRDPDRIARGERHYIFDPTWAGMTGFGGDGKSSTGALNANQLRLARSPAGASGEYRFYLYENIADTLGATLLFRGAGLSENDELEVALNGHPIPAAAITRTRPSDAPSPGGMIWEREEGERKIPCFPERGRYDFRPAPVPAFSTRWFAVTAATTVCGQNTLSLTLSHSDPGAGGEAVVIDEVEVWVDPR